MSKYTLTKRESYGFTLVEMMIVIAIIAIIASIAVPSFSKMLSEKAVQKDAAEIVNGFKQARAQAALSGRDVKLRIDSSEASPYQLTIETVAGGTATLKQYRLSERTEVKHTLTDLEINVQSNGRLSQAPVFSLCDDDFSGERGFQIDFNTSGKASLTRIVCT